MKKLEDLKQELLEHKINNFYVFFGDEYGIRNHYMKYIGKHFQDVKQVDNWENITNLTVSKSLFSVKQLIYVYNDLDFAKQKSEIIETFIKRLSDYTVIFIYEDELTTSNLFKEFSDYITYFSKVKREIGLEFVQSEIKLSRNNMEELTDNCCNDYNLICLEADKIKSYANGNNINTEIAYEELKTKDQLVERKLPYNVDNFMDDILQGRTYNLIYWYNLIKNNYTEEFWYSTSSIFTNYLIAYYIKKYGRYDGSNRCYQYSLPWGRTKIIREYKIPYDAEYLLQCAYDVSKIDQDVKLGKLSIESLLDHFISTIYKKPIK